MKKLEFVFLGPPACGKGTQSKRLAEELGLPHIDTGASLRKASGEDSDTARIIQSCTSQGKIVPPEIIEKIITDRLILRDCEKGFILDGYPRNMEQAGILEKICKKIDTDGCESTLKVFYFELSEELLLDRITNRQSCKNCGCTYNLKYAKPKNDGICDKCGNVLIQRYDDTAATFPKRMKTFNEETKPVIDFYEGQGVLERISAEGESSVVFERLMRAI